MNKKIILSIALLGIIAQTNAQQEEKHIEEVTIASKSTQKINKTGRNITLLTEKDLEKYQGQTLSDVLEQVPGLQISGNFNNNTETKVLRARGGNDANVIILIDGIPLQNVTGATSNIEDLRLLALDNISSIEILNGASSVLYGSNATTAVIDIKTKKYANGKELEVNVGARIASYDTYNQKVSFSGKSNVFSYLISGLNEKSEGLSAAKGNDTFDKDDYEKQNINVKFGVDLGKFDLNILGGWNHFLYKYDNGAFSDGTSRGNDTQTYLGANANYHYNIGKITLNTRYTETERVYENFNISGYKEAYKYLGFNSFMELYNELRVGDFLNFVAGIQHEDQRMDYYNTPFGENNLKLFLNRNNAHFSHFDVFANARLNYAFLYLDAGTRITTHKSFGTHWIYNFNPYLYQEFGNWFGKAGYTIGTAFISPTLYQTFGDGQWTAPNPDLSPETNVSHEINFSFGKQNRSIIFNGAVYRRFQKDALNYGIGKYTNIEGLRTQGFEAGIDIRVNSFIKFGGNFSFVEKKTDNPKSAMLRIPKQRANSYVEISTFKGNKINFTHTFVGRRHDIYYDSAFRPQNVYLSDFNLFNVGINQQINNNLNAYFQLNNFLNKDYVDVIGYTTKNRNFVFGIDYKF